MKGKITFKGGTGSGNFRHSGRPGKVGGSSGGGSIAQAVSQTAVYMASKGYTNDDVYVDLEQPLVSKRRDSADLQKELGAPVATHILFGKSPISPHEVDSKLVEYLESNNRANESLGTTLSRKLDTIPRVSVPLADVHLSQQFIFENPLQRYIKSGNYTSSDMYVVKIRNAYFTHNNNHRIAAAKYNNVAALDLKVIDIGE